MQIGARDRRGIHRVKRFELSHAAPGPVGSSGRWNQDDSPGRGVGPVVNAFVNQFKRHAARITRDLRHRQLIQTALAKYETQRDKRKTAFRDWEAARQMAAATKWEAINHLDRHLEEFARKLEARGAKVHWASDAQQARDIILGIIREKKARSIIKSKAMTAEEI